MTWYLSGPMTGLPEFNYPAFTKAAGALRAMGHTVVSAHEIDHGCEPGEKPWEDYLRRDLVEMLLNCEGIITLPGWSESPGARLEWHVAVTLRMRTARWDGDRLVEAA